MKKYTYFIMVCFIFTATTASAAKDPDRVTFFNRISDFFATVGKSDEKKSAILKDRRNNRRAERIFEAKQEKKEKIQKKMRKQNQAILDKIKTKKVPHSRGGVDAP